MHGGETWQGALKTAVRDPDELCRLLALGDDFAQAARRAARSFPLFATREYLSRVRPGDPTDPLLRQILPIDAEHEVVPGFGADPVGDSQARLGPGALQKYDRRVLLIVTGACAIHCRYCFRRHYPYDESPRSPADWAPVLARLAADTTIDEVILSGGDPLTVVDSQLAQLAEQLAAIPHLKRLRLHTRLPIVLPQRVTPSLVAWLRGTRLAPIMVVHANHPAEIDQEVAGALARLREAGILLLNQAVLLRGVNDSVETLSALGLRLVECGVLPYYLHQLDRVAGGAHFEVPESRGRELVQALRDTLPGYAVPRYVSERAGERSKTVLL